MNSKKLKELRRKTKQLQIEWLKSLVSEEEGEGINLKTLTSLILATGLVCVQVFWK